MGEHQVKVYTRFNRLWHWSQMVSIVLLFASGARILGLYQGVPFGLAVMVQLALLNLEPLTGGPFGIGFIPRPFAAAAGTPALFAALNLALLVAVVATLYLGLERLLRSPWGRVLRAIREDETLSSLPRLKLAGSELEHLVRQFAQPVVEWVNSIYMEGQIPLQTMSDPIEVPGPGQTRALMRDWIMAYLEPEAVQALARVVVKL